MNGYDLPRLRISTAARTTCSTRPSPTRGGCRRWSTTTASTRSIRTASYLPSNTPLSAGIHGTYIRQHRRRPAWVSSACGGSGTPGPPTTATPRPRGLLNSQRRRPAQRLPLGAAVHAADLSVVPAALPGAPAGHPDPDPGHRPDQSAYQDIDDPSGFHGQAVAVGWVKPTIVNRSIRWVAPTLRHTGSAWGDLTMLASSRRNQRERRGIVLVLVLGMLALMALIGITFATFSGQSRISARNFAQSVNQPQRDELMDYALSQLISDTPDRRSAIRGHSLARDMYGNDASVNGYLASRPDGAYMAPNNDPYFYITGVDVARDRHALQPDDQHPLGRSRRSTATTSRAGRCGSRYQDRRRHRRRRPDARDPGRQRVQREFRRRPRLHGEHRADRGQFRRCRPRPADPTPGRRPCTTSPREPPRSLPGQSLIAGTGTPRFILDGRWLHAFNGPGMAANAVHGNFRYNGLLERPEQPSGMDEDYDACDLENWFLAMQSADGSVIIPSFHRPGGHPDTTRRSRPRSTTGAGPRTQPGAAAPATGPTRPRGSSAPAPPTATTRRRSPT